MMMVVILLNAMALQSSGIQYRNLFGFPGGMDSIQAGLVLLEVRAVRGGNESMNERKNKVRMQMQKITGIFFLLMSVLCFFVLNYGTTPDNPEDMGGVLLLGFFSLVLIFSKKYLFESKVEGGD